MGCAFGSVKETPNTVYLPQVRNNNNVPTVYKSDVSRQRQNDQIKNGLAQMNNNINMIMNRIEKLQTQKYSKNNNQNYFRTNQASLLQRQYQNFSNIGKKSVQQKKIVCKSCLHKLKKFTDLKKGIVICNKCKGYGIQIGKQYTDFYCTSSCKSYGYPMFICEECYGKGVILKQ